MAQIEIYRDSVDPILRLRKSQGVFSQATVAGNPSRFAGEMPLKDFRSLGRGSRGAILRGEAKPSRAFVVDGPNIKRIRANYRLSQGQFAALLGISVGTLRNWEQGRRTPEGPARVLLQVAARHPDAVWDVVRPAANRRRSAANASKAERRVHS